MTITFSMTAGDMCKQAMIELGVLPSGGTPTSAEYQDIILRLNSMLKTLAAKGWAPWRDMDGTATILAGDGSVELTPRPSEVSEVRLYQSAIYERPLTRWEADEYSMLPNKSTVGEPSIYNIREMTDGMEIRVWPVPSVDTELHYSYDRVIEDVTTPSNLVDVPQRWTEAIWQMLAARIIPMFGQARLDPATSQFVMARATELERQMMDRDRPAAYRMGPSASGYA